jgi:hypothetical protein
MPRLRSSQIRVMPAARHSRPSAFVSGGITLPMSFKSNWGSHSSSQHGFVVLGLIAGRLSVKLPVTSLPGCVVCASRAGRLSGAARRKFCGGRSCVSRTVGRCHQEMQCSLTLRSSGAPTACRQAWATGARTFSMAQACHHAVGAPLSSNVRHRNPRPHSSKCP